MSVSDDFGVFNDACKLSTDKITSITYRYKRSTRQLNSDFWVTESETAHSLYTGSYGRDTAARGISDLDIGFVLPNALYHQYNAHVGNGQSALLRSVKRSMQKTYPTSDIAGDGQVVVISFNDNGQFEVLPVFENKDSSSWTYPNANGGGEWKVCNPRAEIAAVQQRHQATNGNLKKLCRMARVWRDNCNVPMSGLLIDTLAYQFIEGYEYREKSFTSTIGFFGTFSLTSPGRIRRRHSGGLLVAVLTSTGPGYSRTKRAPPSCGLAKPSRMMWRRGNGPAARNGGKFLAPFTPPEMPLDRLSLESQIRECYGRVAYSHKTRERMADHFTIRLSWVKWGQIVLSALTAGGALRGRLREGFRGVCLGDRRILDRQPTLQSLYEKHRPRKAGAAAPRDRRRPLEYPGIIFEHTINQNISIFTFRRHT